LSTNKVQLYVPLLNEGTDVLRPTTGLFLAADVILVEFPDDYDPEIEEWEFPPGSLVQCIAEYRDGKQILVARSQVIELSHHV
jgi:hypothetical protein